MPSKVALLVLAHSGNRILAKTASFFNDDRFNIYVHLDAKVDLDSYRSELNFYGCKFINERNQIYWGGFSMITATLSLLKEALSDEENSYFVLISDDSFSLLNPDNFFNELVRNPIRIDHWAIKGERAQRYERFYRFDSAHSAARHVEAELRYVAESDVLTYRRLGHLLERGKCPLAIFGGSQWWALPRHIVKSCVTRLETDTWLRESFEFSAIPDEHLFQTLVMNYCVDGESIWGSPMYYDFSRNPKPYIFKNRDELEGLDLSGKLLIRKVSADSSLLNWMSEQ